MGTSEPMVRWVAGGPPRSRRRRCCHRCGANSTSAPSASTSGSLRELRPDILHVNLDNPWTSQYGLLAGVLTRTPMVVVFHGPTPPWRRRQQWLVRPIARRVKAYVCVSHDSARFAESMLGLKPGSARVIHNGMPVPTVLAPPAPESPPGDAAHRGRRPPGPAEGPRRPRSRRCSGAAGLPAGARGRRPRARRARGDGPGVDRWATGSSSQDGSTLRGRRRGHSTWSPCPRSTRASPSSSWRRCWRASRWWRPTVGGIPEIVVPGSTGLLVPPRDRRRAGRGAAHRGRRPDAVAGPWRHVPAGGLEQFTDKAMAARFEALYREVRARSDATG